MIHNCVENVIFQKLNRSNVPTVLNSLLIRKIMIDTSLSTLEKG